MDKFVLPKAIKSPLSEEHSPVTKVSGPRRKLGSAGSPLIIQLSCAAGLERPDVHFTRTVSPT